MSDTTDHTDRTMEELLTGHAETHHNEYLKRTERFNELASQYNNRKTVPLHVVNELIAAACAQGYSEGARNTLYGAINEVMARMMDH